MSNICIFAGTTEGRDLAAFLADFSVSVTVCVATEYGETLLQAGALKPQTQELSGTQASGNVRTLVGVQLGAQVDAQGASAPVVESVPQGITIRTGRMTQPEMQAFFAAEAFTLVIDCTHPYAEVVTENIVAACATTSVPYRRVLRQSAALPIAFQSEQEASNQGDVSHAFSASDVTNMSEASRFSACNSFDRVTVPNTAAAVEYLATTQGNILSTIGAKELNAFANCGYQSRLYARVLPVESSLNACREAQIPPAQIIAMQGPFSYALNKAMIEAYQIKTILTKDGGKVGGFAEKMQIAQDMGLAVVLIQKPVQQVGVSLAEMKEELAAQYALRPLRSAAEQAASESQTESVQIMQTLAQAGLAYKNIQENAVVRSQPHVSLVACGVGDASLMTAQAKHAVQQADALIGAKRLTDTFASPTQAVCNEINSEKIVAWVAAHSECARVAVLLTGDIGFFSGATKLYDALAAKGITDCQPICGVSSPIYLCAKLHTPWQDAVLLSLHGRSQNILPTIQTHKKVFALLGGEHTAQSLCALLCAYGMGDVTVCVGENLSYPNEKITKGTAAELLGVAFAPLSCALILNDAADDTIRFGIEDDAFIRLPKVPMTKAEVRAVSLSKLKLTPDAVVYDVGAGTGSVSVEMALLASQGQVYAIEKNPDALAAIAQNKRKFKAEHITLVEGLAPDCMQDLPAPTHVFIGGSSGNLAQIVDLVLAKNPAARFVLNTVTLETLSEAVAVAKQFAESQIVEIASSQARALGKYHLMTANNPIYIITFQNS